VDPDNRRPVDLELRAAHGQSGLAELAANWRDGRIKQAIIMRTLALRRQAPRLFCVGSYRPVRFEGDWQRCAVAFIRQLGSEWALVVVPRLALRLLRGDGSIVLSPEAWKGTRLVLEELAPSVPLYDALGGGIVEILDERPKIDLLCGSLPLALVSTIIPQVSC
jgi:maltooligosyltrehalose synthase